MDDDGTLVMIGTMLALISVLSKLIKHIREKKEEIEKEFKIKVMNAVVYAAIKPDGTALWPEGKSLKKLQQIKRMVSTRVWQCEFMNDPPDAGQFKLAWMKSFDRGILVLVPQKYVYFTGSDVSAGDGEDSDFKAHIVIALNQEIDKRYTVDAWIKQAILSEFYRAYVDIFQEYKPVQSAFETNGFQRVVKRELDRLCQQLNIYPNIREVVHTSNKMERIIRWQAPVERGDILFSMETGDMEILTHQLNQLGTREHDDGPDAWDMGLDLSINYGGDFDYESAGTRPTQELQREYEGIGSNERFAAGVWSQFRI
jgi:predicted phage terminase large subunit-like protein